MTIKDSHRLFFKGVKIDDRTRKYVEKRIYAIEKLLKKINKIEIEIDIDKKGKFRAEAMIKTPYQMYRAEETSESIEGSVDMVETELRNQITKDLDRVRTEKKRGARSIKKKMTIDENARF